MNKRLFLLNDVTVIYIQRFRLLLIQSNPEHFYSFIHSLKDNSLVLFSAVDFSNAQSASETIDGTFVSPHLASQGTRGATEKHGDNS